MRGSSLLLVIEFPDTRDWILQKTRIESNKNGQEQNKSKKILQILVIHT